MATKLTDAKLQGLKTPEKGQVEHSDSDVPGLRIRIGTTGAKTFILRRRVTGQIRNITIGRYGPRLGLAEARRKARQLISDLESGKPPHSPQRKTGAAAGTIRALMPAYLASKAHLRSLPDLKRVVNTYILPEFGDRLADCITRSEVTEFIAGIAVSKPVRARNVLAQFSAFYSWALPGLDRLPGNPCRDARRPPKAKVRERVLSDDEMAALWKVAEGEALPWGPGLKLLMLTGTRRDEVFAADRAEFDVAAREWVIPPERAKNGIPHIVPLSRQALSILKAIPETEGSAKLFPAYGNAENGPSGYSRALARYRRSLNKTLNRDSCEHWTVHDIRRTVSTGLQRLGVRFEVNEAVLNHVSGAKGGIAGIYQRHDWKDEKRAALDAWAGHLDTLVRQSKARARKTNSGTHA